MPSNRILVVLELILVSSFRLGNGSSINSISTTSNGAKPLVARTANRTKLATKRKRVNVF